jgi:cyclase
MKDRGNEGGRRVRTTEISTRTGRLQEVSEGVFAYIQPDGGWCVNNAGVVTGGDTTVLIDTAATESRARNLRHAVTRVAPAGPNILVNTHHHGDHIFGNAQFAPAATIVAHERARTEMIEAGLGLRNLWPDVAWGQTPLTLPTLTFADRLILHVGDLEVRLLHVGPAHTTNDVVAWIPERKTIFAGDVLMSGVTPYCLMGSIEGSLRAIERLSQLDATVFVCGHGPVAGREVLDNSAAYLRYVQKLAAEGVAAGMSALEVAREADLGEFAELLDSERIVGNLHRAYAEIEGVPLGAPIEILGSFREMIEYHGGLPRCHA